MTAPAVPPTAPTPAAPSAAPSAASPTPAAPPVAAAPTPAAPTPAVPAAPAPTPPAAPFTFKAPEGRVYDSKIISAYGQSAQQLGISNENAQKLLDTIEPVMRERMQAQVAESVEADRASWAKELENDPAFGGANLAANMEAARRTLAAGGDDLPKFLKETGLDSHPALVKWAAKLGSMLSPDALPKATPTTAAPPKSDGEVFYPTMQKKV